MNHPVLVFSKTHNSGVKFCDYFSERNLPGISNYSILQIEQFAAMKIHYWNAKVKDWHYQLVGWSNNEAINPELSV